MKKCIFTFMLLLVSTILFSMQQMPLLARASSLAVLRMQYFSSSVFNHIERFNQEPIEWPEKKKNIVDIYRQRLGKDIQEIETQKQVIKKNNHVAFGSLIGLFFGASALVTGDVIDSTVLSVIGSTFAVGSTGILMGYGSVEKEEKKLALLCKQVDYTKKRMAFEIFQKVSGNEQYLIRQNLANSEEQIGIQQIREWLDTCVIESNKQNELVKELLGIQE